MQKFTKPILALAITAVAAASQAAPAYEEEVIISATRVEGPAMPVATNITVISQKDIEISGVSRLSELLRVQAGIQIQDADGSGGRNVTISTRGFSSNAANNTLVLVDGRKLNNPSIAGPNINSVALADIERIEIVHGSAGVLYGDQAVGGVINIITKRAKAGEMSGSVSASLGTYDMREVTGSVSQGFDNGLSYRLSLVNKESDNYRDNNRSEFESGLLNLRYESARGSVFVEGQKIDDDLRLPGDLSEAQAKDNPKQTFSPSDYSDLNTDLWRIGGEFSLTETWKLLGEYAWRDEDGSIFFFSPYQQSTRVENFTPRLQGRFDAMGGVALLTLGFDGVRSEYKTSYGVNASQDLNAYYGQLVLPVTGNLTATLGGRVGKVDDKNNSYGSKNKNSDELEAYEAGLSCKVSENLTVFARYADAYRFANADEYTYSDLPFGEFLKPQKSSSIEMGFKRVYEKGYASVVAYDMDLEAELFFDVSASLGWGANLNLPDSKRNGLIVEIDHQLMDGLGVKFNYTYTDAEVESGSFKGNEVPFVASNAASLVVEYAATNEVTVYLDANYTGSRYRVGDDLNSRGKVGSETIVNANIQWQKDSWLANLRISNLTDEDYSDYYGYSLWSGNYLYPKPGATAEASITYRF